MYGDWELIFEDDDTFSAKLYPDGEKIEGFETEADAHLTMARLDVAYNKGHDDGELFAKDQIAKNLGLK